MIFGRHTAVIGGLWGDEGKGKIVDLLSEDANIIARFQGGDNAGHTIVTEKGKTILHLIPSGILHTGKKNVLGNGMVINPDSLIQEINSLKEKNIDVNPLNLYLSELAHVITPYHILEDIINEIKSNIGTTLKGIGPAYSDKTNRKGLMMIELINLPENDLEKRLEEKNFELKKEGISTEKILEWVGEKESRKKMIGNFMEKYFTKDYSKNILNSLLDAKKELKEYVTDVSLLLENANQHNQNILFEGAQGTLLDICFGSYPYVTCSNTTIGGVYTGTGIGFPIENRYVIFKAFATRVGEGPFPTEMKNDIAIAEKIADDKTEIGATTGRPRKIGWFDFVLAKYSSRINSATALAITKLDRLDGLDEIKICTAYKIGNETVKNITPIASTLKKCEPIYETLPGWKKSTKDNNFYYHLPKNARRYIERIQELTGIQVKIIGTGQERKSIIIR